MTPEQLLKVRRLCLTREGVRPEIVCAILDYYSGCEQFRPLESIISREQMKIMASVASIAYDVVVESMKLFKHPPRFTFVPEEWPWVASLTVGDFTMPEKLLLACEYGMPAARARHLVFGGHASILCQTNLWIPYIRSFTQDFDAQVFFVCAKLEVIKSTNPRAKTQELVSTYLHAEQNIGRVISLHPDSIKVLELCKKYAVELMHANMQDVAAGKEHGR